MKKLKLILALCALFIGTEAFASTVIFTDEDGNVIGTGSTNNGKDDVIIVVLRGTKAI